jgi:hypothetical protein
MRGGLVPVSAAAFALATTLHGSQTGAGGEVAAMLARVGESVTQYYKRAQSIICVEAVRLQSVGADLLSDVSQPRRLSYELRVAWEPPPAGGAPQATVLRQLLKVNGRAPRPKDQAGCMDPKSVSPEPLGMLLPEGQEEYTFTLAGRGKQNRRAAIMLDYRARKAGPMTVTWTTDECFSVDLPGRSRGRVWIDVETGDVLRLDEHLTGMFDLTLPPRHRRSGGAVSLTIERLDSSIVYRPVTFTEPDETVMLPASIDTVTVVRNAGVPRLRTNQTFSNYQRFVTGGRVVQ